MKANPLFVLNIFFAILILGISSKTHAVNGPGPSWQYCRIVALSPVTPAADFQVKVTLTTATMGNPYTNINSDGSDLRFYDVNDNLCNYWIESWDNTGTSILWVKVPVSGTSNLYMYYGNSAATSVSNGTNTFEFFSDGSSLAGWSNAGANVDNTRGQPAPSLRALGEDYAYRDIGLTTNRILEFEGYVISGAYDLCNFYFLTNASGLGQMFRLECRTGASDYPGFASTTSWTEWTAPADNYPQVLNNTWHNVRIIIKATSADGYINDVSYGSYNFNNNGGYIAVHGDADIVTGGNFDNIRVRLYTASEPVASIGGELSIYISLNVTKTNLDCNGVNTGTITIYASGGTGPYEFSFDNGGNWFSGSNPYTFSNLPSGSSFKVRVKDSSGFTTPLIP